jgi:hypothetical protein
LRQCVFLSFTFFCRTDTDRQLILAFQLEGFRNDEAAHEAFLTGAIQGAGLDVFAETCKLATFLPALQSTPRTDLFPFALPSKGSSLGRLWTTSTRSWTPPELQRCALFALPSSNALFNSPLILSQEIGVGAYSGSSPLIKDRSLLVSAATILPIEARVRLYLFHRAVSRQC